MTQELNDYAFDTFDIIHYIMVGKSKLVDTIFLKHRSFELVS